MSMANLNQDSPLHLADALADEIAKTPADALLAEVAQDLGDRRALASEFDAVVARALRQSRRKQIAAAVKNAGALAAQQLFRKPVLVPVGALAVLVIAVAGYHYHDEQLTGPPIASLDLQARSQGQPDLPPSFSAFNNENPARKTAAVEDKVPVEDKAPAPPMLAPSSAPARSDLVRAREAYDTAQAYQARGRATEALNRGEYDAAIAALYDGIRLCAAYCQPELRGQLSADLARAQSSHTPNVTVAVAAPPPAAAAAVASAKSPSLFAWPVSGHVVVGFGAGTATVADQRAQMQTAEGITIAVPADADIRAAADGIVSFVGADKTRGEFLVIRHDNDLKTGYGQLRKILVKASDQVHRGEVIAKGVVASRGAQPQLYFEVRKGTAPIDPMQYLPQHQ
jgi:murein DD-endopeptidase MepM/ murein hydrolase activator NlpD